MFGIGLPEMIVIFAVALIVVGPDKLPGLARSLAKGLMEMKKTMNQVKDNLTQEGEVLDSVQKDLKKTADELREKMIDVDPAVWQAPANDPTPKNTDTDIIDLQPTAVAPRIEAQTPEAATPAQSIEPTETQSETGEQQPLKALQENRPALLPEKTP
jgi:sec-independent protein translocase protein TatB